MINREMIDVDVIYFTKGIDSYGLKRTTIDESKTRTIKMMCKIYSQSTINDPLYLNVELVGITKDNLLSDSNLILINNIYYNIIKVIPSGRFNQVLLKKTA